jgi:predicted dehydrogenase
MTTGDGLTVLVVGCGSAGSRHARLLRKLGATDLLLFDPDQDLAEKLAAELSATTVDSIEKGLEQGVDGVVIASPPGHHLSAVTLAIEAGANCFVEKPLADSLEGVEQLLDLADERGKFVMVGYNLRFFAPLIELKRIVSSGEIGRVLTVRAEFGQYLPTWRPDADYRKNYITSDSSSGGIILEESHEFDYVQWLAGPVESVYCAAGQLSDLEMKSEDTALVVMRHAGGALSHISIDCTQHGYARGAHVVGSEGTATWTFPSTLTTVLRDGSRSEEDLEAEFAGAYELEMQEFVDCLSGSRTPSVSGREALESLKITLAARESSQNGSEVRL